jgi:hypothetical protein
MAPNIQDPAHDLTITDATDGFEAQGYDAQFAAMEGSLIRCFACRTDSPASSFAIDALERTEGTSDPADMVANVAARCPSCRARGVLTLKYGPEASLEDHEALLVLDDNRTPQSGGTSVD